MKQVDNLKFEDTDKKYINIVKKDFLKEKSALRLYLRKNLLQELDSYPKNSSKETQKELREAYALQSKLKDAEIKFIKHMHELRQHYKLWSIVCEKHLNLRLSPVFFENIANQTESLINFIKLHFKRPRPYQLAEYFDLPNKTFVDKRYQTASYPSGHACEAFMFCNILSEKIPNKSRLLGIVATKIATSRIQAGVHLRSDIECGKVLANQIISHNLCNYNF